MGSSRQRRSGVALLISLLTALVLSGCTTPHRAAPPIPTFDDAPGPAAAGPARAQPGALPADCGALLSADMVTALIGGMLGSTDVRTLHDVPAPSAGRLARMTCVYTRNASPGGPPAGTRALRVVIASFVAPDAAAAQTTANDAVETPVGAVLPVRLGAATGHWYPEDGEDLLSLTYDRFTLEIVAPRRGPPSPNGEAFAVDLALRTLATVSPAGPPPTSAGPPP